MWKAGSALMGSEITLAVGNLEVDWGKNDIYHDHGPLFQPEDLGPATYYYFDRKGNPISKKKDAFVRPLSKLLPRLELLGHTLDTARKEFDELAALNVYRTEIEFDQLAAAWKAVDASSVSRDYDAGDYNLGEFFSKEIVGRLTLAEPIEPGKYFGSRQTGELMENLHPWTILRLVAENPVNLQTPVTWYFSDVVEGGWVDEDRPRGGLSPSQRFLIVTEGSSDAKILKRGLELIRPDVSDFFYFVDMEEGYPFTGTGNLHRFCHGLASIQILNRVLVIYDNDAEGRSRAIETEVLNLPANMRVVRLPDLPIFESFPTLGPSGPAVENINGRAAAIECYLDLRWKEARPPRVRWTSYNEKLGCYQGALLRKESYARRFLALRRPESGYDFENLARVLDMIIMECVDMTRVA
jgi:HEPN/Toprim N-terminal domain 1